MEREGLIVGQKDRLRDAVELVVWFGEHQKPLVAAIELICAVVQETESFFALSGPEKKLMRVTWCLLYWMTWVLNCVLVCCVLL